MKFVPFACIFVVIAMMGCGNTRRLHVEEKGLNTDGPVTYQFHSALYYPFEIMPRFDGYLVGIEKVRRTADVLPSVRNRPEEYGLKEKALYDKFSDGKVMAVTHVIRHFADAQVSENCTIHNAYVQEPKSAQRQLIPPCEAAGHPLAEPELAFSNSWKALDDLKKDIGRRLKARSSTAGKAEAGGDTVFGSGSQYSHIVVVVMGWNTIQEEAVRNMNSLIWNLARAHVAGSGARGFDVRFNPLVIGVTWPSQWNSDWIDPAVKLISFPTKAGDADEVGMSWLGVLLHDTIPKMKNVPIVVIGHSFGAKASSVAACAGPAVVPPTTGQLLPLRTIDVVVNLQPAFLSERIFGRTSWLQNVVYPKGCKAVNRFVLTSSDSDEAVPMPFWGTYMGEAKSYRKFCAPDWNGERIVSCLTAHGNGEVRLERPGNYGISYVDASAMISENAYGTSGGSHSDIYRREHGRFIYDIVMGNEPWMMTREK